MAVWQVSERNRPLSDRKIETVTDRLWSILACYLRKSYIALIELNGLMKRSPAGLRVLVDEVGSDVFKWDIFSMEFTTRHETIGAFS